MKQDRSRPTVFNFGSSTIKNFVMAIVGMIATPFILQKVGDSNFGLFKTLTTFYAQFTILEFGLYSTIINLFNRDIHRDDAHKAGILWWGLKKFRKSSIYCLIGSALTTYFIFKKFVTLSNFDDLVLSLFIIQISYLFMPFVVYRAYFEAHHQAYIVHKLHLFGSLITTMTSIILVLYFPSTTSLIVATILGQIFYNFMMKASLPKNILHSAKTKIDETNSKLQLSYFINEIAGKLCLAIDELVVSFMMGPKYVVPFFISQRLPQLIQLQLLNIGSSSWSTMGVIFNGGDTHLFNKRLIELTKISAIIGSSLLVVIAIYNKSFVGLWVNDGEYAGSTFTFIVCLNAFIFPIQSLWGWSFSYSQLINKLNPITLVQTIVNVVLSLFLTYKYGLIGPVLGTLISYLSVSMIFIALSMKNNFKISLVSLHSSWLMPLIFAIAFYAIAAQFPEALKTPHWTSLVFKMSATGMIFFFLSVVIFLSKSERLEYQERIQKLFKKKA
jgi:O-antigen/teichoic acid export membrane protein